MEEFIAPGCEATPKPYRDAVSLALRVRPGIPDLVALLAMAEPELPSRSCRPTTSSQIGASPGIDGSQGGVYRSSPSGGIDEPGGASSRS